MNPIPWEQANPRASENLSGVSEDQYVLSEEDKFQLQQDLLTTELTLAVRTDNLAHGQEDGDRASKAAA